MYNKKASLNLSIQAIVIVVIAFVVLGLGLGFVRTQFSSIDESSSQVQEQIRQQIMDDLRRGDKKLNFPAQQLTLEAGDSSVQGIGIKNTEDDDSVLKLEFYVKGTDKTFHKLEPDEEKTFPAKTGDASTNILWDGDPQTLSAGDARVLSVTITAPDKKGNYLYKASLVLESGEIFDEKTFFIKTT